MSPAPAERWRIRLGAEAERDFVAIVAWTAERFGARQARAYQRTLSAAMVALSDGPNAPGSVARNEIAAGLRSLHVARRGRPGRHFLIYRAVGGDTIEVVRILHDAMDLARHVPSEQA